MKRMNPYINGFWYCNVAKHYKKYSNTFTDINPFNSFSIHNILP